MEMKKINTNWPVIKIVLLIIAVVTTLMQQPETLQEAPPLFIYPIVSLFTFVFSIAFFKGSSVHNKLSKGNFKNNPLKIISDPLPFHHLGALLLIASGSSETIRAIITDNMIDPFSYFSLFIGFPLLLSVYIANRKFIKIK
ncbi:MAG: hypothetical protein ABIJ59_19380 [Pseudomonadota bacterium]